VVTADLFVSLKDGLTMTTSTPRALNVDVLYTHTLGEPTCIVQSDIPYPDGADVLGKRKFLEENYDWLRKALMQEPRGHKDMYGVFLAPPTTAEFDAGTIWMNGLDFMHTCGHGTIGLSIAMIEAGLKAREGLVTLTL
jgi:proline racemase